GRQKIPPKSLRPCRARGSGTRRPYASPGRFPRRPNPLWEMLAGFGDMSVRDQADSHGDLLAFARRADREAYHGPESPAIFTICWILPRFARDTEGVSGVFATSRTRRMAVFPKLVLQVLTMGWGGRRGRARGRGGLSMRISTLVICAFTIAA